MKIVVLSGGTGTPKLLQGLKDLADLTVIVNTAEDIWISGNKICPDIDSVIYALAEIIDEERWWGIRGDSFRTHEQLKRLGFDEFMMIGDLDRATHIFRSELLRQGYTLTEATKKLKNAFGVKAEVLPMCEEDVATIIVTPQGEMHFQEFWVKRKGEPEVLDIYFKGIENAKATDDVVKALECCDGVIIGPSNPITSVMPILLVKGIKERLRRKKVVAVSPIVGNRPVSGPAGKFMRAKGYEVSPLGVVEVYADFLDVLVVDSSDADLVGKYKGIEVVATDTIMKGKEDAKRLSEFLLELFRL
ncbi:2-phospho-L-lactate transferase [Archaeoglobus sp.]